MKKPIIAGLLAAALTAALLATGAHAGSPDAPNLLPGVWDYVQEHRLADLPDPNEPLELVQAYGNTPAGSDKVDFYRALVVKYPDSRHAHQGLANSLQAQLAAGGHGDPQLLNKEIFHAYLAASKIAQQFGKTMYIDGVRQYGQAAGLTEQAQAWFDQLLAKDTHNWQVNMNYAELAKAQNSPLAEVFYKKAMQSRPEGNLDAHVGLAEYLLDRGRYDEAFAVNLLPHEDSRYLDFLHGYALEKMGRGFAAVSYYYAAQEFSSAFPFPTCYAVKGSPYQTGIYFAD
ncbi:hypothetical protein EV586_103496 [Tumebacillus sp. BK434]|uniref:hypothetical protein n=1 Tax=Tumebacillus sp. BK434 TaxID=2512169 RepID=UPI00104DC43A|nr:hypothetical protein [Tumebacillus sp. BK434]TCP55837.1 hypothetical protein EV586_103496 [Tumebacillus sp. BK434]